MNDDALGTAAGSHYPRAVQKVYRPAPNIRSASLLCAVLLPVLGAAGCSEPLPDEERIRTLIEEAEYAAESEDLAALRSLIAEDYTDAYGNDARALTMMLRGYFLRHDHIYLLTRIEDLEISEDYAEAAVLVGMVGDPADDWGLVGDLYRIDAELRERDGTWQIVRAAWRRGP